MNAFVGICIYHWLNHNGGTGIQGKKSLKETQKESPDDINDMPFTTLLSAQIADW